LLSYSRGGLIAVALSTGAVLVLQMPPRQRLATAAGLLLLLGAVGAFVLPAIEHARSQRAAVASPSVLARSGDRSGWDGTAEGLISGGPATLSNDPGRGVLRVRP